MHLTTTTQRIGAMLLMAFTTFQTNAAEPGKVSVLTFSTFFQSMAASLHDQLVPQP